MKIVGDIRVGYSRLHLPVGCAQRVFINRFDIGLKREVVSVLLETGETLLSADYVVVTI